MGKLFNVEDMIYLSRPDKWPKYPLCPVYRKDEKGTVTTLDPTQVLLIHFEVLGQININSCPRKEYASVREMVQDGWKVDKRG